MRDQREAVAVEGAAGLEFKSTARWNLHTGAVDPKLEHVIVKTVCGFLNAEGGTLLIEVEVEDNGNV
ncbi:MAG: ATP-binding protein, partial [Actinomycetota bacterium]|nr:ATP-binding protein [Actinomycetota bacterium]